MLNNSTAAASRLDAKTTTTKQTKEKADQLEINAIGDFLLELYHKLIITPRTDWIIEKNILRDEFRQYINASPSNSYVRKKFGVLNIASIGGLLWRTSFLINTPRGSDYFRIKCVALFDYRKMKRADYDEKRKNGELCDVVTSENMTLTNLLDQAIEEHPVNEDSERFHLGYQASAEQTRRPNFLLNSNGCYICQCNFENVADFEKHVEHHSDVSDFESLQSMKKSDSPIFQLFYQLCEKSHYFRFTMETSLDDIIIEKIVIVQSHSMFYVHNMRVPYAMPSDRRNTFFVDSHNFTISLEQPIVIVFHYASSDRVYHVEQHHFMRIEAFPIVNFSFNPYRLSSAVLFKSKLQLPHYLPPDELRRCLQSNNSTEELMNISNGFKDYYTNDKCLTPYNMKQTLTVLLQVEDMDTLSSYVRIRQSNVTLRQFSKEISVKLKINNSLYLENILSPYDEVLIIEEQSGSDEITKNLMLENPDDIMKNKKLKIYFGKIERVSNNRVTMECERKIPENKTFTLIFRPVRLVLRYQYRALDLLDKLSYAEKKRFLFPDVKFQIDRHLTALASMYSLQLTNKTIYENPEQLQAVQQIANSCKYEAPYIIFGPPGTGKTTTICEAIIQLYLRRVNTKILIMAGSNSACDEIALRLLQVCTQLNEKNTLVRVYSRSNDKRIENINELLLEFSNMYGAHFYPHVDTLHSYRIVVCTLSVAGKLSTGNFGKNNIGAMLFTHVFVDEASASTETETLTGIVLALSPHSNLILSGDHKQLGPVLQSQRAAALGLGVSMLERLLQRDCYKVNDDGSYNFSIQTRLRRNYRSHPEIVKLYNQLYYNDELVALAKPENYSMAAKWQTLPNPDFPIMFHSVFGQSVQDRNSVSLCNNQEVEVVMDYVKDFMYFGINGKKVSQSDIGIISPYKNQYLRIQEQLNLRNWYQIETGSVETFQGKEKEIIIVSFVRSFSSTLGFLDNPRRLNVTLSRPKSLLILIGNPRTLSLNEDFKFIIDNCKAQKTLVGAKYYNEMNKPADSLDAGVKTVLSTLGLLRLDNEGEDVDSNQKNTPKAKNQYKKKPKSKANKKKNVTNDKISTEVYYNQNSHPSQLRQTMKKHVTSTSQQFKRQQYEKYKNLVMEDEATRASNTLDELFDALPDVPKADNHNDTETIRRTSIEPLEAEKPTSIKNIPTVVCNQQQPFHNKAQQTNSTPILKNHSIPNEIPQLPKPLLNNKTNPEQQTPTTSHANKTQTAQKQPEQRSYRNPFLDNIDSTTTTTTSNTNSTQRQQQQQQERPYSFEHIICRTAVDYFALKHKQLLQQQQKHQAPNPISNNSNPSQQHQRIRVPSNSNIQQQNEAPRPQRDLPFANATNSYYGQPERRPPTVPPTAPPTAPPKKNKNSCIIA